MESLDVAGLRALLETYKQVALASWPDMHAGLEQRSAGWGSASQADLQAEIDRLIRESSAPEVTVRVFWKLGADYRFGGCNRQFAQDAGMSEPRELVGLDDFDKRIPWRMQASKYRTDDQEIVKTAVPKLDIVERQQSTTGITWVRAGKAPIRLSDGKVIGVLGMYEILDPAVGRRLWTERLAVKTPRPG